MDWKDRIEPIQSGLERKRKKAWWKESDERVKLPRKLQVYLERNDPKFIGELMRFALLFLNGETSRKSGAWLWSLYLNPHPLAQKGLQKIFSSYRNHWDLIRQFPDSVQSEIWPKLPSLYCGLYTLAYPNKQLFRYIKGIYKRAEEKRNAPVWAKLAYLWDHRFHYDDQMVLSPNTKKYLQRRAWRTLRKLGEQHSDDYVHMATELLLLYGAYEGKYMGLYDEHRRYRWVTVPLFYQRTLSQILYRNSTVLSMQEGKRTIASDQLDQLANERAEAFPEIWDRHPDQLLRLIKESQSRLIVDFAARALRQGNQNYLDQLSVDDLLRLIPTNYQRPGTNFFVDEIIRRLDLDRLDTDLIIRLLSHPNYEVSNRIRRIKLDRLPFHLLEELYQKMVARYKGHRRARNVWPQLFLEYLNQMPAEQTDVTLIAQAMHSTDWSFIHLFANFLVQYSDRLTAKQKKYLINDRMKNLGSYWNLKHWLQFFRDNWLSELRQVASFKLIHRMLKGRNSWGYIELIELIFDHIDYSIHPYTGKELLQFHQKISYRTSLRRKVEQRLLENPEGLGVDIETMVGFICRSLDVNQSRDVIDELSTSHHKWLQSNMPELIDHLWTKMIDPATDEQVSQIIVERWLGGSFWAEVVTHVPPAKIWSLLHQDRADLQDLGARLIDEKNLVDTLTLEDLRHLVHGRVARVRSKGRDWLIKVISQADEDQLAALTETDWDDTRHWMMGYLRSLSEEQVTPKLIYGLLDSARTDIQQFAMELVTIYRQRIDYIELMLRASESPHIEVQEFALELADKVDWNPELLKRMAYFFRTILFYVGKGRKLKNKAMAVLTQLGPSSLEMAQEVSEILSAVAFTSGKKDFAEILLLLTKCKQAYPELDSIVRIHR